MGTCNVQIFMCGLWPFPPGATVISVGCEEVPGSPGRRQVAGRVTFLPAARLAARGAWRVPYGAGGNTEGIACHTVCSVLASCADEDLCKMTDVVTICGTRCRRQ